MTAEDRADVAAMAEAQHALATRAWLLKKRCQRSGYESRALSALRVAWQHMEAAAVALTDTTRLGS